MVALVLVAAITNDRRQAYGGSGAPGLSQRTKPATPKDAQRVIDTVARGAAPAAQRAALNRYLRGRGIPASLIGTVMRSSRDGIGLVPSRNGGGARIGGRGLVPAGQSWPRSPDGHALTFVALIDFAKLPHLAPLPRAGRLALYYNFSLDDPHWLDPVAAARAYYLPPGAPSASPKPPDESNSIAEIALRGRLMSFAGDAAEIVESTTDEPVRKKLIDAMNDMHTNDLQPTHLLGSSFNVQGSPIAELLYDLSGKDVDVRPDSRAKYTRVERRDARRWVLLAQIEEQGDFIIADGGVLYYAIPRRDLAQRRFDRVAVIMQSH